MKEPVPFTPSITQNIFITVGQLAINWSLMEFSINAMVACIFHNFGGKDIEPELPRELRRKLQFLRKNLATNQSVTQIREATLALLDRISNLTVIRHDIIHGYLHKYDPDGHKLTFISLDRDADKTIHIMSERTIEARELLEIGVEAGQIGHDLAQITSGLFAIAGESKVGNVLGKL